MSLTGASYYRTRHHVQNTKPRLQAEKDMKKELNTLLDQKIDDQNPDSKIPTLEKAVKFYKLKKMNSLPQTARGHLEREYFLNNSLKNLEKNRIENFIKKETKKSIEFNDSTIEKFNASHQKFKIVSVFQKIINKFKKFIDCMELCSSNSSSVSTSETKALSTDHIAVTTTINFDALPAYDNSFDNVSSVTFGDLHGNPLKLLHELVCTGVFEYRSDLNDIEKGNGYKAIVYCVKESHASNDYKNASHVDNFTKLVEHLFVIKNPNIFVRFLGDMFCDRISNDLLMMGLLKVLHSKIMACHRHDPNPYKPYEIIFSNHDLIFVQYWVFDTINSDLRDIPRKNYHINQGYQYRSFLRLMEFVENNTEKKRKYQSDFDTFYKPYLQLLSFDHETSSDSAVVFSHAMFDESVLDSFCRKYAVTLPENPTLETKINAANDKFHEMLTQKDEKSAFYQEIHSELPDPDRSPIQFMVWARQDAFKEHGKLIPMANLHNVHGHDSDIVAGRTTLDEHTGKTYEGRLDFLFENDCVTIAVQKKTSSSQSSCHMKMHEPQST